MPSEPKRADAYPSEVATGSPKGYAPNEKKLERIPIPAERNAL
jgi:hypothetical protein